MQIDKQQILDFLQEQGRTEEKQRAEQELPGQVDPQKEEHQNLLQQLGINPQELIRKFVGGSFGL